MRTANGKTLQTVRYSNGLILNGANQDLGVHYIELEEHDKKSGQLLYRSCWITDITVSAQNALQLCQAGRSRWKIENETFNTLKNQGYNIEHNYGHGKRYLSSVLAMPATLAFCVDQVAQYLDAAFQNALQSCGSRKNLWEKLRQVFDLLPAQSMEAILRFIATRKQLQHPMLI